MSVRFSGSAVVGVSDGELLLTCAGGGRLLAGDDSDGELVVVFVSSVLLVKAVVKDDDSAKVGGMLGAELGPLVSDPCVGMPVLMTVGLVVGTGLVERSAVGV